MTNRCGRVCRSPSFSRHAQHIERNGSRPSIKQAEIRESRHVPRLVTQWLNECALLGHELIDEVLFVNVIQRNPLRTHHHERERLNLLAMGLFSVDEACSDELRQTVAPGEQFALEDSFRSLSELSVEV